MRTAKIVAFHLDAVGTSHNEPQAWTVLLDNGMVSQEVDPGHIEVGQEYELTFADLDEPNSNTVWSYTESDAWKQYYKELDEIKEE